MRLLMDIKTNTRLITCGVPTDILVIIFSYYMGFRMDTRHVVDYQLAVKKKQADEAATIAANVAVSRRRALEFLWDDLLDPDAIVAYHEASRQPKKPFALDEDYEDDCNWYYDDSTNDDANEDANDDVDDADTS